MIKLLVNRVNTFCLSVFLFTYLISCNNNKKNYFTSLASAQTNITFTNQLENMELFNILYYLYYYNGGGVATGDINNDGFRIFILQPTAKATINFTSTKAILSLKI